MAITYIEKFTKNQKDKSYEMGLFFLKKRYHTIFFEMKRVFYSV